jgi:hypothetical protein
MMGNDKTGSNWLLMGSRTTQMIFSKHMMQFGLLLILSMLLGCQSPEIPPAIALNTPAAVERAILAGGLGTEFAERAKKNGNLYLAEIANPGIPYQVFSFSDYQAGYTVLVENHRLVLLCAGFGGGCARDFVIRQENGKPILSYHFDIGSGISHEMSGRYLLGSGKATWDVSCAQANPH